MAWDVSLYRLLRILPELHWYCSSICLSASQRKELLIERTDNNYATNITGFCAACMLGNSGPYPLQQATRSPLAPLAWAWPQQWPVHGPMPIGLTPTPDCPVSYALFAHFTPSSFLSFTTKIPFRNTQKFRQSWLTKRFIFLNCDSYIPSLNILSKIQKRIIHSERPTIITRKLWTTNNEPCIEKERPWKNMIINHSCYVWW